MLALIPEMANPNDNMDDAMIDLINTGAKAPIQISKAKMMGVTTLLIMKKLWETILMRSIYNLVYMYIYEIKINDIYTNIFILVCVAL